MINLNGNPILKSPISYLSQIEIIQQNWGSWAPIFYYAAFFINFLLCIWIIDYGFDSGWGIDLTMLLSISAMLLPVIIGLPLIWLISKSG